jgi:hypothetical protein
MRPSTLLVTVVAATVLAGAFILGRETAPARVITERVVERVPSLAVAAAPPSGAVMRAAFDERPCAATPPAPPPEPARDGVALAAALAVLDEAMADGRWSEDDRSRVIGSMRDLSADEAAAIMETLMPALGSGALRVELDGPPI